MTQTATPDLATVLRAAIAAKLKSVRVGLPARVESYDPGTLTCSAQPLVLEGYLDETGQRQTERLPVINSIPVVFVGGGGARLTFPVAPGDTCWLMFASSSIDRWVALGGEIDPMDDRRHHLSDAVAIVGLSDAASASAAHASAVVLEAADIRLGDGGASDAAIKGDAFLSALGTLITAIGTAVGGIPGGSGAGTGVATALTTFQNAATTYTSNRVKIA